MPLEGNAMTTLDEKLSAYLDNMLPEDERRALETLLAADPALGERLEALALANAEFVAHAADIDRTEMSDGLKRQLAALHAASGAGDTVVAFRLRRNLSAFLSDHRALAACAAVAAGAFALHIAQPAGDVGGARDAGGLVYAGHAVREMLEDAPSGTPVGLSDNGEGTVRFSFASADGSYCRLADVSDGGAGTRLVACRENDGWRVVIAASTSRPDHPETDIYRTASAEAARSVEAVLDSLMADAPLGAEEEAEIIRRNWPVAEPANSNVKGD
jgi:hypothetical protein